MKQCLLLALLIISSCRQTGSEENATVVADSVSAVDTVRHQPALTAAEVPHDDNPLHPLSDFENATSFKLSDTIVADFNGDGFIDKAIYKKENETSGISILHGATHEEVRIGFGKQFAHMTEFNWVDYWGLVEDKETSEVLFSEDDEVLESRIVILQNPSIALGKNEVGGGLITFRNGTYEWIHQTC